MKDGRVSLLSTIADLYLKNPVFILDSSGVKDPLLHQTETLARCFFLKPTRVLIADVIGLGKTITALRILEMLRVYDRASKVLIIVPSILLPQWIEELKYFGIIPTIIRREKLRELGKFTTFPSGVYIGTLDRLKREEYFRLIEKESWDLIIVDETQKLGFVGGKPNLRWRVLGSFIARSKDTNVVLLSATPHKGYDYDYLARLYMVDPSLSSLGSPKALKRISRSLDSSFYVSTHNVILHRRTKADINEVYEQREVFKKCYMLAVLIKPLSHEAKMLSNLIEVGEKGLTQYYHKLALRGYIDPAKINGVVRLLRKLIMKRGLSSPRALVETFGKMVKKRKEILARLEGEEELEEVKRVVEKKIPEFEAELERILDPEAELDEEEELKEPDKIFNEVADSIAVLLPKKYVEKADEAITIAWRVISGELQDSKLETLKQLIEETFREHEGKFRDLNGAKIVIFTEFKDTAEYVYSKLKEWLRGKYGSKAEDMVKLITSKNRGEYKKIAKWFRENPFAKILVTTDVLGEGLNLQAANVLVNYEITYSPIRLEQRIGRIWRYGQKRGCYVFNLFYVHRYEGDVARSIFGKLYGINEAVGRQELTLGDEVYASAIGDSLFEKTIKERLGREYAEYSRYLGGLIPVAVRHRGKEIRLTESSIIDALFEGELEALVEKFIRTIVDLAKKIREKRIYPEPLTREAIERFLKQSFGIGNSEETQYIANKLMEIYRETTGSYPSPLGSKRFDTYLKHVRNRGEILDPDSNRLFFALPSDKKALYVLAIASIEVRNGVLKEYLNTRVYKEPLLIELNVERRKVHIYRGKELVDVLAKLLPYALEVDEVYGADTLAENEWRHAISYVRSRIQNNYSTVTIDYNDMVKRVKEYEDSKIVAGASNFFRCKVEVTEVKPLCFFALVGLFPESISRPTTGVWFGFENQYLREIVLKYEKESGRKPDIKKREKEHYDVYSYSDEEERYIEAKGFVKSRLEVRLTDKEYQKARELGDKFWLYLVYGVGTKNPVMLCIKNPVRKIELSKVERAVVRREYVWSRKLEL